MATDRLVDAHVHVASSDEDAFPRQPTGAGSDWWRHESGVERLHQNLEASGVEGAVVVQAVGVYGYDCTYAASVTADDPALAFVGAIDLSGDDIEADFRTLARHDHLGGVRLFGVGAANAEWLTNGTGQLVWSLAAEVGCTLVPTIFSDGLPALRTLMERTPEVVVAIDHCAFPGFAGPGAMDNLAALAEVPSLHLKVSSHNLDGEGDPARFVDTLAEAYGPTRLCWGSDHPQHQSKTYPQLVELARHAARNLDAEHRAGFLGGNTRRLWW
ncbi:MAG: amidohydrolase family protein [Microthrixaceae bacterium]|nr:amidohydrolase family protein [Microthrixaceae bacterium]